MTGIASRIIHSGRFSDVMNAHTTLSRLIARLCFWPFEVRIVSRSEAASAVEVEVLEEVADRLGAHAPAEVDAEAVGGAEPVLELAEEHLVLDDLLRLELPEELPRLLEAVDAVHGRVARVGAARLDVHVHLADLERPLDDGVEVFLLHPPVGLQAEVVREVADLVRGRLRLGRLDRLAQEPVAEVACLLEVLRVDVLHELGVVALELVASEERVEDAPDVLRDRALLRAARLLVLGAERRERVTDLRGGRRDLLELARGEPTVVADRRGTDELADLLRVLRRDLRGDLLEEAGREVAGLLERRQALLLGPRQETARPELVVLVEALLLALREEVAPALEPSFERRELLVAVDEDPLRLGAHLVLEVGDVLLARPRCPPRSRWTRRSRGPSRAPSERCRGGSRCGSGRP